MDQVTEALEIKFDLSKISMNDMLSLLEFSAKAALQNEDPTTAEKTTPTEFLVFVRSVRACLVGSSRPLTGNDFNALAENFWLSFKDSGNPKN